MEGAVQEHLPHGEREDGDRERKSDVELRAQVALVGKSHVDGLVRCGPSARAFAAASRLGGAGASLGGFGLHRVPRRGSRGSVRRRIILLQSQAELLETLDSDCGENPFAAREMGVQDGLAVRNFVR